MKLRIFEDTPREAKIKEITEALHIKMAELRALDASYDIFEFISTELGYLPELVDGKNIKKRLNAIHNEFKERTEDYFFADASIPHKPFAFDVYKACKELKATGTKKSGDDFFTEVAEKFFTDRELSKDMSGSDVKRLYYAFKNLIEKPNSKA